MTQYSLFRQSLGGLAPALDRRDPMAPPFDRVLEQVAHLLVVIHDQDSSDVVRHRTHVLRQWVSGSSGPIE